MSCHVPDDDINSKLRVGSRIVQKRVNCEVKYGRMIFSISRLKYLPNAYYNIGVVMARGEKRHQRVRRVVIFDVLGKDSPRRIL